MLCKVCHEDKETTDFRPQSKVCKECTVTKRRENKTAPLADNQIIAYGVVLTFDVNWKPHNLPNETVLAIVRDMRADVGLLKLIDKYSLPRSVIVDICGGKAYADVTGIRLSEAKVWWQPPAKKPCKETAMATP